METGESCTSVRLWTCRDEFPLVIGELPPCHTLRSTAASLTRAAEYAY